MASTIPSLVSSSNLMRKSNIIPQLYTFSPSRIKPGSNNYKPVVILRSLLWLYSTSPPEYSPKTPAEFPGPGHGQETIIPSVPIEVPESSPGPEIDPGSTPDEVVHTRPEEIGTPLPVPGPDSPVPPLDPPRGPDTLPPPIGPDIIPPPDRMPPDMPPIPPWPTDPPIGPDIIPPPDRMPPVSRWPEDPPGPTLVF